MKLISCYVENFGNIRQRSFGFDGGLTSLCERNGYGKTTLAAFLRAMFYGLKTTRGKEFGERKRYYPFEGGRFGGNVVFEKDGVTYKIERFFGEKSATDDTLAVYRGGSPIPAAEDAGKEFFGLDEQSFLRTIFLNSADTETGATGDISRMLNGFVDDADYEGAQKRLEDRKKELKRRGGGKIAEVREEIVRLNAEIDNKEKINAALTEKYADRISMAEKIAALETRRSAATDKNLVLQKWQTYDNIVKDAAAEREKLNAVLEKYPAGLPAADEAETFKACADKLIIEKEKLATLSFTGDKARRLEELSARFGNGVPADEALAAANGKAAAVIRTEAEIKNYERILADAGENKFAAGVPDGEEVKKYEEKLKALRGKRGGAVTPAGKKIPVVFALLAIILLCAGAGLMLVSNIAGGVVLALGAADILVAIFVYFKAQINGLKAGAPSPESDTENEIRSFLARYGYYSDGGVEVDFNNLARDLETYNSGVEERVKYTRLLSEKRAEAESAKAQVLSFLNRYNFSGENVQDELTRLGAFAAEYAALNAEKEGIAARAAASVADIEAHGRTLRNILTKYSIKEREDLSALASETERDVAEADRLKERLKTLEKRAADYGAQNGLDERPSEAEEDTQGIDKLLAEMRERVSLLDREINDDETAVERLAELREELEAAQEEEKSLKKKYELLVKTSDLLEQAEQNLKDRYISPVADSFINYSGLLEKALGEKVIFDKDFRVKFERGGEERPDGHLSAGQKSLCALCLRLALIDNMYRTEKPFIIMDDPFVHLDKEHMQRAEILIKELARGRQIIYFCCHESRKI